MGRTLNLLNQSFARARHLLGVGQPRAAATLLKRVARLSTLPASAAADAHHLLGEAHLKLGDHRVARRHLRRSLRLEPQNAAANHLLARAIESDPHADACRASRPYRRALELAPRDPRLLADAGAYFVQMGRVKMGLALLNQAVELAPDHAGVLRTMVETLCEAERFDEALKAVRVAEFRLRNEPRLAQLRERAEFLQARHAQRQALKEGSATAAEAPVLLPFLGVVADRPRAASNGTRYRRDVISMSRPHLPRSPRRIDSGRSG